MFSGLQNALVVTNSSMLQKVLDTPKADDNVCTWDYSTPPLYENCIEKLQSFKESMPHISGTQKGQGLEADTSTCSAARLPC